MEKVFNRSAPNKATTLEQELVNAKKRELWLIENLEAISSYNSHVEKNGAFSDELRSFQWPIFLRSIYGEERLHSEQLLYLSLSPGFIE